MRKSFGIRASGTEGKWGRREMAYPVPCGRSPGVAGGQRNMQTPGSAPARQRQSEDCL
ncbi:MAG: hypothetical protein ACI399_07515 [Candidatus Cryptobacteroides sp.]